MQIYASQELRIAAHFLRRIFNPLSTPLTFANGVSKKNQRETLQRLHCPLAVAFTSALPLDVSVDNSDPRVRLAYERTLLVYERTQIAWVRTALALISFGFAISTFFSYLREQQGERATVLSPHAVGVTMIVIALIGLTLATWRQQRAVKLLRSRCPDLLTPIGGHVMAGMIAFLGILALLADLIVNLLNRIALTVPRNFPDGLPVPLVRNLRLHATSTRVASFASKQVAPLITR